MDFFKALFGKNNRFFLNDGDAIKNLMSRAVTETAVRELALNIAIGMISKTIAKCEIKEFFSGKEVKKQEYYLWNVKPNANENAVQFFHKLIYKLCFDGEALVVFDKAYNDKTTQALVADSFEIKSNRTLYAKTYTSVRVEELEFETVFSADDVLYFKLNNEDIRRLIDLFYNSYKNLIDMSLKSYKRSRGERGTLKIGRIPGDTEYEEYTQKIMSQFMKPYFEGDNAVLPLSEGQEYTRINGTGQRELTEADDVRKLLNDVFDITAMAFGIPPALMRGEMADTSQLMVNFLTFCIDPICDMIATEINAKRYGRDGYLKGNFVKIDTSSVKHVDLFDVATAVDKLISSGATSINEVRRALGLPRIDEEWADEHFITKNYQQIIDALDAAAEGGDKDAEEILQSISRYFGERGAHIHLRGHILLGMVGKRRVQLHPGERNSQS